MFEVTFKSDDPTALNILAGAIADIGEYLKEQRLKAAQSGNVVGLDAASPLAAPTSSAEVVELEERRGPGRPKGSTKAAKAAKDVETKVETEPTKPTEEPATPEPETVATVTDLFEDDPPPPEPAAIVNVTKGDVTEAMQRVVDMHGMKVGENMLVELGVTSLKLKDLPPEKYADCYRLAETWLAKPPASKATAGKAASA